MQIDQQSVFWHIFILQITMAAFLNPPCSSEGLARCKILMKDVIFHHKYTKTKYSSSERNLSF